MSGKRLRVLYHIPSLNLINAGYTIYFGYKHAFEDLGHTFKPLTAQDDAEHVFNSYSPDIFYTSLNFYNMKFLDIELLKKNKKKGLKVFINIPYWHSPMSKLRVNEEGSISSNEEYIRLIRSGNFGDIYFNVCEQGSMRMEGFEKTTGYPYHTVLLAADRTISQQPIISKYISDISYIGTYLPNKRDFIKQYVFPLKNKYNTKIYGKDWSFLDRSLNTMNKLGQFYNIPYLRSFRKHDLTLQEERQIYKSSKISLNIHEDFQKEDKGEINERTFKIPASGGFEVVDAVPSLSNYFKIGEELVVSYSRADWFDKIDYYLKNPEKRLPIIEAGKKKILEKHTYHNRVKQILSIYKTI